MLEGALVRIAPLFTHDAGAAESEVVEDRGARNVEENADRGVVFHLNAIDLRDLRGHAGACGGALKGELDVAGLEVLAVVELNAAAQVEYILGSGNDVIALREAGDDLAGCGIECQKRIVHQDGVGVLKAGVLREGIQTGNIFIDSNRQHFLFAGTAGVVVLRFVAASGKQSQCHCKCKDQT